MPEILSNLSPLVVFLAIAAIGFLFLIVIWWWEIFSIVLDLTREWMVRQTVMAFWTAVSSAFL